MMEEDGRYQRVVGRLELDNDRGFVRGHLELC